MTTDGGAILGQTPMKSQRIGLPAASEPTEGGIFRTKENISFKGRDNRNCNFQMKGITTFSTYQTISCLLCAGCDAGIDKKIFS